MTIKPIVAVALVVIGQISPARAAESEGAQLANESMALVSYASMSNLGASDPECESGQFEKFDINALVETEIAPVIDRLAAARLGSLTSQQRGLMLSFLKTMEKHPNAVNGIKQIYVTKKADAIAQYGMSGGCPALATMIKTVVQQKRLALRRM